MTSHESGSRKAHITNCRIVDGDQEEHLGKSWSVVLTGGQWDVCSASDLKLLAVLGCAKLLVHRCLYIYIRTFAIICCICDMNQRT